MSSFRSIAVRVLRLREKDKHAAWLCGLAREVNTVFNYCNELSVRVFDLLRGTLVVAVGQLWSREPGLARAQRARHRNRTRAIHAKIANRRKDFLHKLSTDLVKANGAVFVGNVNASALAKTRLVKSVVRSDP